MLDEFHDAVVSLTEDEFLGRYGPWQPMTPAEISEVDRVSTEEEWVFKRDQSVRIPWDRALRQIDGIWYLKPELALLFKAGQDREKDREDLAVARLEPVERQWLTVTLEKLGYAEWAELTRQES
jgi:hypothetical protein